MTQDQQAADQCLLILHKADVGFRGLTSTPLEFPDDSF